MALYIKKERMKDLEKFGFKKITNRYIHNFPFDDCDLCIDIKTRYLYGENYNTADMNGCVGGIYVKIFDLIKADMVEKVEE